VTPDIAPFATATLAEHEIQILFRIDGLDVASGPATTFADLAEGPAIPADQIPALQGRYRGTKVWKRAPSGDAGQDFHRHIRDIVGGKREDLAIRWMPDDTARRLLDRADLYEQQIDPALRSTKRLTLLLTDAAQARLGRHGIACDGLLARIKDITLTVFRTGHAFATTVLELARRDNQPLGVLELLEAQVLLARFGKLAWTDTRGGGFVPGDPFRLSDLLHRLALGENKPSHVAQRVTTYTYARLNEPTPTAVRDRFALHLARHYTTDYVVSSDIGGVVFVADFETVRHAVALEGAATIVGATLERPELPVFLHDFRTLTFRRHYVPIALLARHEHAFLVERTSASVLSSEELAHEDKAVQKLEGLRDSTLRFRLSYRFSELSFVSMHNALNRAFRQVMQLDQMMEKLSADVASVEMHLRDRRDAQHHRDELEKHRRYYWTSVLGSAALAGLTTYTIGKEVGELVVEAAAGLRPIEKHVELVPGIIAVTLGLLVAGAAILIGLRRGPPAPEDGHEHGHAGHFTRHAMIENVIHTVHKK
jgi:hypothetical protein